ncbi:MAG: hypothetical protein QM578_12550 [Pantoea sp.]|uniref:hypothetical protein n=1 Tax=Pantoea sp. TaxID=69393 RepID=UPI0039E2FC90
MMLTLVRDDMRIEFEKFCADGRHSTDGFTGKWYAEDFTNMAWEAWQEAWKIAAKRYSGDDDGETDIPSA